jgi:hypothetical protein
MISLLLYLVVVMVVSPSWPSLRSSRHDAHHHSYRAQRICTEYYATLVGRKINFWRKCQEKRRLRLSFIVTVICLLNFTHKNRRIATQSKIHTMSRNMLFLQKLSYGYETLDMTSEGLGDMFEGYVNGERGPPSA